MKKSFSFVNENNSITTPDEKNYSNDDEKGGNNKPKTELENQYETFMNSRKLDVPASIPRL
jgi:hypothetical protein